jgi:hypothetical protein
MSRVRHMLVVLAATCVFTTGNPSVTWAYDEDGHYYTAALLRSYRPPGVDGRANQEANLLSVCAQLPDLAKELDAVTLRVKVTPSISGFFWGSFSRCWSDDVRYMANVHHYLHALTGETDAKGRPVEASKVTDAAAATLSGLLSRVSAQREFNPNLVCAAGLSVHLLGDSFAHRRLDAPNRMYAAGLGHYYDNHDPDRVLYNRLDGKTDRSPMWGEFVTRLARNLGIAIDKARSDAVAALIKANMPALAPDFNEGRMIDGLRRIIGTPPAPTTWDLFKTPVETLTENDGWWGRHVLKRSCKEALHDLYGGTLPARYGEIDCGRAWSYLLEVAVEKFGDIAPACPLKR